ncbi:MAG: plastocyanin/azurin family copper-binding protein [Pyrinomonadaceae bacterium]
MKRGLALIFCTLLLSISAFAHQAFTLVSSEKKTIKESELAPLEKNQTAGNKDNTTLTFTEKEIRLVIVTGPEVDMLSYRIQGVRNATLAVPAAARITLLFVNVDGDMRHDIRFGHIVGEFPVRPDITETAGSTKLDPVGEDKILQAEEIVVKANENGMYKYFCSVPTHAKGGMWGHVAVGVKPDANAKPPEKTEHIHSADEEKGHDHAEPGVKKPEPKPSETQHNHNMPTVAQPSPTPHQPGHTDGMDKAEDHSGHTKTMSATVNIGDPMNREGSGTSWLPDSSPIYAYSKMYENGGMVMLMGTAFVRYTHIGSTRDVSVAGKGDRNRFDAPNMLMAMYSRPVGKRSQIGFRVMASLDPLTQRGYGYPLLYQSGELYKGEPLHDRQHPHDFISELAGTFSTKVGEKQSFFVYGGIVGEPALGPPMYLHRTSGSNNPDAPIGHHWQDASHISWGVVTGGYSFGKFKFEASAFNGTEPDENRWGFDTLRLNSWSTRFSFNPTKDLSFQISHGFLKHPERAEPELDHIRRTTASAIYNKNFSDTRNWTSAFIWGQNNKEGEFTNSYLFESDYTFGKNAIFGRFEMVQKDGHELVLDHDDPIHDDVFLVGAYSIGYVRDVVKDKRLDVGVGGMATFNSNPSALVPYYGGTRHAGWQLFVRLRPSKMKH